MSVNVLLQRLSQSQPRTFPLHIALILTSTKWTPLQVRKCSRPNPTSRLSLSQRGSNQPCLLMNDTTRCERGLDFSGLGLRCCCFPHT